MHRHINDGVDWVGYVDWTVRDFHGYETTRGSTYNAYLVRGAKTALIDTVKAPYAQKLLDHLAELLPPGKVDYIVCNHAEPDHAGALPVVLNACPRAEVVCDAKCRDALARHFDVTRWKFHIVKTGDRLDLGGKTLAFVETPMAHWPESMATHLVEDRILFSMDAFGQHYASSGRFADEQPWDEVRAELTTYYANILMCYGRPVAGAIKALEGLDIALVAPSHGVMFRGADIGRVMELYTCWAAQRLSAKVLVIYDSMWESTARMAHAVYEGALEVPGVQAKLFHVRHANTTVLATEMLDAAAVAFGSPTLNQGMMPQMAATLTYLTGLRPEGRVAFAFGSYGWGRGGPEAVHACLENMKCRMLCEPLKHQFVPDAAALQRCRDAGRQLGEEARKAGGH